MMRFRVSPRTVLISIVAGAILTSATVVLPILRPTNMTVLAFPDASSPDVTSVRTYEIIYAYGVCVVTSRLESYAKYPERLNDSYFAKPALPKWLPASEDNLRMDLAAGWPFLAARGYAVPTSPKDPSSAFTWHGCCDFGYSPTLWDGTWRRCIPLIPLPQGATIDVLLFALLVLSCHVVPAYVRYRVRRQKHLCAACAYPLMGHEGMCPECGGRV